MFKRNEPILETKLVLKGSNPQICRASETENFKISIDEDKSEEFSLITYALTTKLDGIYLIDVKEIKNPHSDLLNSNFFRAD